MTYEYDYEGWTEEDKAEEAAELQERLAALGAAPQSAPAMATQVANGAPSAGPDDAAFQAAVAQAQTPEQVHALMAEYTTTAEAAERARSDQTEQALALAKVSSRGQVDYASAIAAATNQAEVLDACRAFGVPVARDY